MSYHIPRRKISLSYIYCISVFFLTIAVLLELNNREGPFPGWLKFQWTEVSSRESLGYRNPSQFMETDSSAHTGYFYRYRDFSNNTRWTGHCICDLPDLPFNGLPASTVI